MARVLIVDDDTELVGMLTMFLEDQNHEVASAGEPVEGLKVCRDFHPEIIILDYHMPGSTGAHLFETFRRNQSTAKTPILFMSAVVNANEIFKETDEHGLSRFLKKPVELAQLKKIITEMVALGKSQT